MIEERDRRVRARSLSLLKSKINEEPHGRSPLRSSEIALNARREVRESKREQIENWITR
jgi:hypothetical protein